MGHIPRSKVPPAWASVFVWAWQQWRTSTLRCIVRIQLVNHKSRHENGDAGNPVLASLNLIDRLYLIYLAVITVLAVFSGRSLAAVVLGHAAIALAIILLAANRFRSATLRFAHD